VGGLNAGRVPQVIGIRYPAPLVLSPFGAAGLTYLKTLSGGYQGFLWVPILHLLLPQLSRNKVMIRALFMRFFAL
jgi:hypothetical protein